MTVPITNAALAELDRLAGEATPGPWEIADFGTSIWAAAKQAHDYANNDELYNTVCTLSDDEYATNDAALIASLRNNYPALRARLELAERALDAAHKFLDAESGHDLSEGAALEEALAAYRAATGGES